MKILAALKKIKHLDRKITKTLDRIKKYCSIVVDNENDASPAYNAEDIRVMQQQVRDWAVHKATIRSAIHLTNVKTKAVFRGRSMSIDELLLLQNIVIPAEMSTLTSLRRKEKGGYGAASKKDSWVVLQYEPKNRDESIEKLENYTEELDELLDNLNIETDVVDLD